MFILIPILTQYTLFSQHFLHRITTHEDWLYVSSKTLLTSSLDREVKSGPTITGNPDSIISSTTKCPSVQWSNVSFKLNSFAIRIAVKISSARCTCAFNGISLRITGNQHSIRKSSSPAEIFSCSFFPYIILPETILPLTFRQFPFYFLA